MLWDLRFSIRTVMRSPGFAAIAIVTLALGIAATVAIFSLFYQVLLRSLAAPQPDRLVVLHATGLNLPGGRSSRNHESVFSYPMYQRLASNTSLFETAAA